MEYRRGRQYGFRAILLIILKLETPSADMAVYDTAEARAGLRISIFG